VIPSKATSFLLPDSALEMLLHPQAALSSFQQNEIAAAPLQRVQSWGDFVPQPQRWWDCSGWS